MTTRAIIHGSIGQLWNSFFGGSLISKILGEKMEPTARLGGCLQTDDIRSKARAPKWKFSRVPSANWRPSLPIKRNQPVRLTTNQNLRWKYSANFHVPSQGKPLTSTRDTVVIQLTNYSPMTASVVTKFGVLAYNVANLKKNKNKRNFEKIMIVFFVCFLSFSFHFNFSFCLVVIFISIIFITSVRRVRPRKMGAKRAGKRSRRDINGTRKSFTFFTFILLQYSTFPRHTHTHTHGMMSIISKKKMSSSFFFHY